MAIFLLTLHVVLVIGFTLRILLRDDLSPQTRLAWFIVLVVLPYAGSVFYFLFGEIDIGHHANKRHKEVCDQIRARAAHLMGRPEDTERLIGSALQAGLSICGFNQWISGDCRKPG